MLLVGDNEIILSIDDNLVITLSVDHNEIIMLSVDDVILLLVGIIVS